MIKFIRFIFILFLLFSTYNISYSQSADKQLKTYVAECVNYKANKGIDSTYYAKLNKLELLLNNFIKENQPTDIYLIALGKYAQEIAQINHNKAITILMEAIEMGEKLDFKQSLALNLHNLGSIYASNKQNNKAIEIFTKTNAAFKALEDWGAYAWNLIDIGNIYFELDFFNRSLDYYKQALEVFKNHFDGNILNDGKAVCFQNMGLVMSEKKYSDSALFYYYKSLNSRKKAKQFNNLSYAYSYIADEYNYMQIYDSAEYYYRKCIEVDKKVGYSDNLIESYRQLADFSNDRGKKEEGLKYNYICYRISKKLNNKFQMAISENHIGYTFYYMNDLDSAILHFTKSYNLSIELECVSNLYATANNLIIIYLKKGDYKSAIPYYKKIIELKDAEITNNTSKTALDFEISERKKEKQRLEEKNKKQEEANWILAGIIIFVVIILILIVFNRRQLKKQSIIIKKNLDDLKIANAHLNKTYSIIAHDLKGPIGNTIALLNIINSQEQKIGDAEKDLSLKVIHKTLKDTYDLMLDLLSWSRLQDGEFPIKPEKLNLKQSVDDSLNLVMELAKAKSISFRLDLKDDCFAFADRNMTKIIINNLLSNAIKFTHEGGEIKVNMASNSNYCSLTIADNGVGMNAEQLENIFDKSVYTSSVGTNDEKGSGFGLKVVYEFIQLNKGKISVKSKVGQGTEFKVDLPLDMD